MWWRKDFSWLAKGKSGKAITSLGRLVERFWYMLECLDMVHC